MLLLQTKKSIILTTNAFLIILLLSSHIQIQAESTDKRDTAHTLWEHGRNAFNEKDYPSALEKFNESLTIYKKTGDRQSEADLLTWMAATKIETDDFVKALNYLKESKEIYSKIHGKPGEKAHFKDVDKTMKVFVLYTEGRQYRDAKDYESGIKKTREALQLVREMGIKQYEIELLLVIMAFEWEQHLDAKDYESALKKLNEALRLARERELMRFENIIRLEIGDAYLQMGADQNELKNYTEAESYFQKALNIYRELNKKEDEGDTLVHIATLYFYKDENAKSQSYIKKALKIYEGIDDKKGLAVALDWAGAIYSKNHKLSKALDYFKKALTIYQELGLQNNVAKTSQSLSNTYSGLGYYNIPLELHRKALNIIQEEGNDHEVSSIIHNIGNKYCAVGNYTEALNAYKKSLKIFKEHNDLTNQGNVLVNIGKAHSELGDYLKAIDSLKEALEIFEGLEDNSGQKNAIDSLSKIYTLLGNQENAQDYSTKSQNIAQAYEQTKDGQLSFLLNQGEVFLAEKKYDKALDSYRQALSLSKEIGDYIGEEICTVRIGMIYFILGEYPKALEFYKQSLKVSREQKSKIGETGALIGIAHIYLVQNNFKKAREYYKQALGIQKETGSKQNEMHYLSFIGVTYSSQKEYEKAEVYFEIALTMSEEMGLSDTIWRIKSQLGNNAGGSGQLQKAKNHFSEAINTIESIREKISVEDYKTSFIENKLSVYGNMILLLLKLKENEEAFNYVERAKSRSLLDLLGNKVKLEKGKDKEVSQEERKLQRRITKLLEKVQKEQSQPREKQRAVLTKWKKELDQTRGKYADFLLRVKRENPELSSLVSVNPLTLKEVQNLLEPDTTLLEYYILHFNEGTDYVGCWIIDKNECRVLLQPASKLSSKIFSFREKITTLKPDYEKEAEELYDLLIRPAKPYIKTKKICIVPHSVLHYLPFQALINTDYIKNKVENKPRFLIEEYDIFYAPSASVLRFVLEKRKEISGKVLAFGNPEFEDKDLNLPHAEEEVRRIKENYPDTSIYMNENATEEKVKRLSGNYDIIHFASHGELNPESPLFSCIKMAKEKDEDGRLEVHEIFNLDLANTSLVTLSACETGLGKLSSGDELIGLTRGFIYAGTPSIVASLWSVNDKSTSDLMSLFYKNLKTHSKVEALRMAQLEMINGEVGRGIVRGVGGITTSKEGEGKPQSSMTVNGSHPYFWAPFILQGDWK